MIRRCEDPRNKQFKNYGARGIAVCQRWKSLPNFVSDMESSFFEGATIERKDNDLGYSPENCIWATQREQTNNRRVTTFVDSPWGRVPMSIAAERVGIPYPLFKGRVREGWSPERLFDPANARRLRRRSGQANRE
jgi:hypothetical protein